MKKMKIRIIRKGEIKFNDCDGINLCNKINNKAYFLINKTKKRILEPKFRTLSRFTYSFRYIFLIFMIFLFIVSYILKGNLGYLYTQSEVNKIEQIFGVDNQMALIYSSNHKSFSNYG